VNCALFLSKTGNNEDGGVCRDGGKIEGSTRGSNSVSTESWGLTGLKTGAGETVRGCLRGMPRSRGEISSGGAANHYFIAAGEGLGAAALARVGFGGADYKFVED